MVEPKTRAAIHKCTSR